MDFYEKHRKRLHRFEILAIHHDKDVNTFRSLDEKMAAIAAEWWKGRSLPFPVLLDDEGRTFERYGIRGLPTTLLIDPEGRLIKLKLTALEVLENELNGSPK